MIFIESYTNQLRITIIASCIKIIFCKTKIILKKFRSKCVVAIRCIHSRNRNMFNYRCQIIWVVWLFLFLANIFLFSFIENIFNYSLPILHQKNAEYLHLYLPFEIEQSQWQPINFAAEYYLAGVFAFKCCIAIMHNKSALVQPERWAMQNWCW